MVFATDLHRVPSQKQNVEKQKQLERIAAEKKRRAEQQRDLQLKRQREQQASVRARQKMHQNKLQQEKVRSVKRNQSRGKENSFLGEMVKPYLDSVLATLQNKIMKIFLRIEQMSFLSRSVAVILGKRRRPRSHGPVYVKRPAYTFKTFPDNVLHVRGLVKKFHRYREPLHVLEYILTVPVFVYRRYVISALHCRYSRYTACQQVGEIVLYMLIVETET